MLYAITDGVNTIGDKTNDLAQLIKDLARYEELEIMCNDAEANRSDGEGIGIYLAFRYDYTIMGYVENDNEFHPFQGYGYEYIVGCAHNYGWIAVRDSLIADYDGDTEKMINDDVMSRRNKVSKRGKRVL